MAWWRGREAKQIKSYSDTGKRINAVGDPADLPDDTVADRLRRTPNDGAICVGTEASRKALAGALPTDGGPQARRAGLLVLDQMWAGCGP
ncbi:MAG TPA: hypothetical protein GXX24_03365 [Paracoccus solventivorans]|uniref:Uncharacterized protein n=1 Tax=Paracoccus solventivorans TaxID=53463 RepID=A0A832QVF6_9RHOB|nr:hypothetical protein [Paracoccus solventivorans]HHW33167.1 hypothetical protein [Paracoccus solventivorans]